MSKMAQSFARSSWWALVALGAVLLAGCRDEPPSPAGASGSAASSGKRANPEGDAARGRAQRVSPEAQKLFRVEVCAFGTLGLLDVRDAYLKSLGGAEPGPKKIPSFGIDQGATAAPSDGKAPAKSGEGAQAPGKPAPSSTPTASGSASTQPQTPPRLDTSWLVSSTLPFNQALHSCTIAKKLAQPPAPELDAEMERYDQAVTEIHKLVVEAHDYYQGKNYESDAFKHGKELHAQLVKAFAQLDERMSALGTALEAWHKQLPKTPDTLDANGQLSESAVGEARALAVLLLSKPEPTPDAVKQAIDRLKSAADALEAAGAKDAAAPHPLLVAPALRELLDKAAVAQQQLESKALTPRAVREVAGRYAGTVDASQRALSRLLGVRGFKGRPRAEGGLHPTPDLRPVRPPPPPAGSVAPAQP
jgi:hypothetical protein